MGWYYWIGAESSRPGALSSEQEIERLGNCLSLIKHASALISVDTYKAETASLFYPKGPISSMIFRRWIQCVAWIGCQIQCQHCLMHKQYNPARCKIIRRIPMWSWMSKRCYLNPSKKPDHLHLSIMIDPGIGFGKTLVHNLALLRHLDYLKQLSNR